MPNNLQQLTFGWNFNKKIKKNILPNNLQQLTFDFYSRFNQKIKKDVLPKNLQYLTFGRYFNKKIKKDVLPKKIIKLTSYNYINIRIKNNIIPYNIEQLEHIGYNKINLKILLQILFYYKIKTINKKQYKILCRTIKRLNKANIKEYDTDNYKLFCYNYIKKKSIKINFVKYFTDCFDEI